MAKDNLQNYFRGQQVALQWLPVLRAMASELSAQIDAKALRQLFFKIGERFAKDTDDLFHGAQSLVQLEERLNDFWLRINWGWVDLNEAKGFIEITHWAAPLAEALVTMHRTGALGYSKASIRAFSACWAPVRRW